MFKIIQADLKNKIHQDAIFDLLNIYINDSMGGGIPHEIASKKKLINGLRDSGNSIIYLAMHNSEFAGMAVCFTSFSTFKLKKLINIHDLIVSPEYRNKKIGRKIMEHIERNSKKAGYGKMTLEVRADNDRARHLYRKLGFTDCDPPMLFWIKHI